MDTYNVDIEFPVIQIIESGQQGLPGLAAAFVGGETLSGTINGSNATFQSAYDFVSSSVVVKINGLAQRNPQDFTTQGLRNILFTESPQIGDVLQIDYLRA